MMSMFWIHRIGGARIPLVFRHALAGRQDVEALVALGPQEVPAALQMADQAVRLVLGGHADAADAGVERVGQREIDDARLAAEIHRRLGAPVGQFHQAAAAPAGQHIGHGVAGQWCGLCDGSANVFLPSSAVVFRLCRSEYSKIKVASGGKVRFGLGRLPVASARRAP